MAENLDKLINKYNAQYAFHNAGESVKSSGEKDIDNDSVKQAVVVLKQSVDTAEIEGLDKISFYAGNEKMTFIFSDEDVYGLLTPSDIGNITIELADRKVKSGTKVKLKERKKIAVKAPKAEEKKKEEKKAEKESKKEENKAAKVSTANYKLDASILDTVKDIAGEYLEDFAEDIVNNMMRESKISPDELTNEKIEEFLKKLTKSSSLIIGPTHANEMIGKINKQITE